MLWLNREPARALGEKWKPVFRITGAATDLTEGVFSHSITSTPPCYTSRTLTHCDTCSKFFSINLSKSRLS